MPVRFTAVADPSPSHLGDAASLTPHSPFITASFVASRRMLGERVWLLGLEDDGRLISACAAFMRGSYFSRSLEIASLPDVPHPDAFWAGLLEFCGRRGIVDLRIDSYASNAVRIPSLPGERARRPRREYVLDIRTDHDLWARITPHHRRHIARARKRGLELRRGGDADARNSHARLMEASMERRHHRGESVPAASRSRELHAFIQSGAGELFQAVRHNEPLSSMLILRAARGGYLQTAGTSAEGMACGASHFLVYSVARILRAEGTHLFNMGGAGQDHPGLQRFKAGFGTRATDLEAASFRFAGALRRILGRVTQRVRRNVRPPANVERDLRSAGIE